MAQPLARKSLARCLGGGGLRQHAGGGAEFGLGLLGLQLQIDFIQGCQRLADIDGLADLDQALCDLAGDPEAHVGLDPGRMVPTKLRSGDSGLVMHRCDQHRARREWLSRRPVSLQPANAIARNASNTPAKSLE